jgi:hypothetical protein
MLTPKHFTAIAKSMNIEACGYVIFEHAKNDDLRPICAATRDSRNSPNPEHEAQNTTRNPPSPSPVAAKADGIASIPEPRIVLEMLMHDESIVPVYVNGRGSSMCGKSMDSSSSGLSDWSWLLTLSCSSDCATAEYSSLDLPFRFAIRGKELLYDLIVEIRSIGSIAMRYKLEMSGVDVSNGARCVEAAG